MPAALHHALSVARPRRDNELITQLPLTAVKSVTECFGACFSLPRLVFVCFVSPELHVSPGFDGVNSIICCWHVRAINSRVAAASFPTIVVISRSV